MQDVMTMLSALRRPRLLIRAARLGADEYRRDRHLRRILRCDAPPRNGAALLRLMEIEHDLDQKRRDDDPAYSLPRHLDVLIAMMGEARLLAAAYPEEVSQGRAAT